MCLRNLAEAGRLVNTEWQYQNFERNRYRDFFFPKQSCLKPKSRLFSWDQILQNRNWYFFPRPNFPKPNMRLFFQDQILRNQKQNPTKIGKSLETATETETSQYPWQFLERSFPPFPSFFSSPPGKKIFSFFKYFPRFSSLSFSSSGGELQRRRNRDRFSEHENQRIIQWTQAAPGRRRPQLTVHKRNSSCGVVTKYLP